MTKNIASETQKILLITGVSGAGKTTLLHTLAGLRQPQQGQLWIDGQPLTQLDSKNRARQIGVLLQEATPAFPASVREVALQGRYPHLSPWQWETPADIEHVEKALLQVGLAELGDRDQQLLSGGERQRVAIARALVTDPDCLLADEPTGNLDKSSALAFMALMAQVNEQFGTSVVVVTHDMELAEKMNQVYRLDDGFLSVDARSAG